MIYRMLLGAVMLLLVGGTTFTIGVDIKKDARAYKHQGVAFLQSNLGGYGHA